MPYDGSGSFTHLYNWLTDKANNVLVTASRFQATYADIATAFTNCMTRNGQSPATANIPMGGHRITGLADGIGGTDAATVSQVPALAAVEVAYFIASSGTAVTIDWANGAIQILTLDDNCLITVNDPPTPGDYYLYLIQDATGGRAVTWAGATYSAGRWLDAAAAPVLNKLANSTELVGFKFTVAWFQQHVGCVGRKSQYYILANSAGSQILADLDNVALTFVTEVTDPYSEFASPTFTAKVAGLYRLDVQVNFARNSGTVDGWVELGAILGSNTQRMTERANLGVINDPAGVALSLTANLVAGQTAAASLINATGGGILVTDNSSFMVTRLGD